MCFEKGYILVSIRDDNTNNHTTAVPISNMSNIINNYCGLSVRTLKFVSPNSEVCQSEHNVVCQSEL